jgi:hypothetical protein
MEFSLFKAFFDEILLYVCNAIRSVLLVCLGVNI